MTDPTPDRLADALTAGCWWYADGRTLPELLALAGAAGYACPGALAAALLARGWRQQGSGAAFLWYPPEQAVADQERRLELSLYPWIVGMSPDAPAC